MHFGAVVAVVAVVMGVVAMGMVVMVAVQHDNYCDNAT